MRIRISFFAALMLLGLSRAASQNILWVDSVQAGPQQTVQFAVIIANAQPFVAFQCDIQLPASLAYINNSATLTGRSNDHSVAVALPAPQTIRLIAYSLSSNPFLGNSGAVLTFSCQSQTQPGTFPLSLSGPIIGDASGGNILSGSWPGSFTLLAPRIQLETDSLDFGSVPLGQTVDRSLTIRNTGTIQLLVASLRLSQPEIHLLDSSALTIDAGGSVTRAVRFQPVNKGIKSGTIPISNNDPRDSLKSVSLKASAYAVNEIRVGSVLARSGYPVTLGIRINNMERFVGCQFALPLPPSMRYVQGSAVLTSRKADHIISADTVSGNTLKVLTFSPTNTPFAGSDGDVLSVTFQVSGAGGSSPIPISSPLIADSSGANVLSASYTGTLEIAAPHIQLGSTSLSFGSVSIRDTGTVSVVLSNSGNDTLTVNTMTSNDTSFWNVTSLPLTLNPGASANLQLRFHNRLAGSYSGRLTILHNDAVRNPSTIDVTAAAFTPNRLGVVSGSGRQLTNAALPFTITNAGQFVAFQFDITLPPVLTYQTGTVLLSGRAQGHSVAASVLPDGKIRVLAYSLSQTPFLGDSGEVVRFTVALSDTSGVFPVVVSNVIISNAQNQNIVSGSDNGTFTIYGKVRARLKVLLEGPFNPTANAMNTALNSSGSLHDHFGSTSVPGLAVDSISLEVRDSAASSTAGIRRFHPAWLLSDGSIRDFADTTRDYVDFDAVDGNYYLVVSHRNHLAVMSSTSLTLSGSSPAVYDFTTSQEQAYGTHPMKLIGTRYCLYAGDANASGIVTSSDANGVFGALLTSGYTSADVNLSGVVSTADANIIFQNLLVGSQVNKPAQSPEEKVRQ